MRRSRVAQRFAFLVFALAVPAPARAEPPASPAARRAADSSAQKQAEALFAKGSAAFQRWQFVHAEQKYRQALTHWEHPVIYLYLSRTLEKQGHLESAYETLQQALRQDPELLSREDTQVAGELQTSLESRLAQIEVHCAEPGAEVLLDGEPWFTAPGPQRTMIRPGQHVIIVRKAGYFPVTEVATLLPGKQTRLDVQMSVDESRVERRWERWQPWAVAGGGVATSLLGGLLLGQAKNDYSDFADKLEPCSRARYCNPLSLRYRDRGTWKNVIGTGAVIAGSAAAVIGLAGVLLNQPQFYRSESKAGVRFDFAPLVSGNGASVSAEIEF